MKVATISECESCGRRWGGELLEPRALTALAMLVSAAGLAPAGCYECNPEPWERNFRQAEELGLPYPAEKRRTERLAGEGFRYFDGRERVPSEIPYPWKEGSPQ